MRLIKETDKTEYKTKLGDGDGVAESVGVLVGS